MNPVETYIRDLRDIRATGSAVPETSYYGALEALFNVIGKSLKPKVRCVINIQNRGAGIPDGGLFTPDQFGRRGDALPEGQIPARGVIEVKSTKDDVIAVARSRQVAGYLARYGQVLVTNYRDFLLVGRDRDGKAALLERYSLAADERSFWHVAADPRLAADAHGERLADYLTRVMLYEAPLSEPKDVAWFLASYARDAKARIEGAKELPALAAVRRALEASLGLTFEGERGDHFFRSTLVQTLFYGVFSAWVLWSRRQTPADEDATFDWKDAAWSLHVPMIRALFEQIATPSKLGPLGIAETLDWTGAVLDRVDRAAFFSRFDEDQAVQYFYEPFLEAFDPELRKELGVWYTPYEIVRYMVARVDTVLREELGVAAGLADPRVHVLDPCCGTGAYLVEVLKRIDETLREQGADALHGTDLKRAAMERVFGFEILPAPFVVAHLQLGLLLQKLGAPLAGARGGQRVYETRHERAGVYLTNALTGWEPTTHPKQHLIFPELEAERDAADRVKQDAPILVILGNPPYNGFAGVAVKEERDLSSAYRRALRGPQPEGRGLNDLYVRFFRMAERRISEVSGRGIVCFISNSSWIEGQSFTGMRERYLNAFDYIRLDDLHGDKFRTGKLTPEGDPDPSVFSTERNREGIQVGTAIITLARRQAHLGADGVGIRDFWGRTKIRDLLASIESNSHRPYRLHRPSVELGYPYAEGALGEAYYAWPRLIDLFGAAFPGMYTARDDVLVDIDEAELVRRMTAYFDPRIGDTEIFERMPNAMTSGKRFDAVAVRRYLAGRGLLRTNVVRYCYRPFDTRWLYWEPETDLLDRKREEYVAQIFEGNVWIATQQRARRGWTRPQVIRPVGSLHLVESGTTCIPLLVRSSGTSLTLFSQDGDEQALPAGKAVQPNLSDASAEYLRALGADASALFHHSIAVTHSSLYERENVAALDQDWARIPLPANSDSLRQSTILGGELASLLDTEREIIGVTGGKLRPELRFVGGISRVGGGRLGESADDLALTARWGVAGKGGITMPGRGKAIEREYTPEERAAIADGAAALGLSSEQALAHLGATTYDVYLNEVAYWRNVPRRVWEYMLGGYQVIKKWLSYRELALLGRPLSVDEAREVGSIARRIAAILLLEPRLDASYEAVKAATYAWPAAPAGR